MGTSWSKPSRPRSNLTPVRRSSADRIMEAFPELVILAIAKRMTSPEDLVALSQVNSRFRNVIGNCSEIWTALIKEQAISVDANILRLAAKLKNKFSFACEAKLAYLVIRKTQQNIKAGEIRPVCNITSDKVPGLNVQLVKSSDFVGCVWAMKLSRVGRLCLKVWSPSDQRCLDLSKDLGRKSRKVVKIHFVQIFDRVIVIGLGKSKHINRACKLIAVELCFGPDQSSAEFLWEKDFSNSVQITSTSDNKLLGLAGRRKFSSVQILEPKTGASLRSVQINHWPLDMDLVRLGVQGQVLVLFNKDKASSKGCFKVDILSGAWSFFPDVVGAELLHGGDDNVLTDVLNLPALNIVIRRVSDRLIFADLNQQRKRKISIHSLSGFRGRVSSKLLLTSTSLVVATEIKKSGSSMKRISCDVFEFSPKI